VSRCLVARRPEVFQNQLRAIRVGHVSRLVTRRASIGTLPQDSHEHLKPRTVMSTYCRQRSILLICLFFALTACSLPWSGNDSSPSRSQPNQGSDSKERSVGTPTVPPPDPSVSSDSFDIAACTIRGTEGRDHPLRGTDGNDVICGLGGNDLIEGFAGNDVLFGGDGDDGLYGGDGDDVLMQGLGVGMGIIEGGSGNDRIDSGSMPGNWVRGDAGNDTIRALSCNIADGGDGNDVIVAIGPGLVGIWGCTVFAGDGDDLGILLDGISGHFQRGKNPLTEAPSATAPVGLCTFSTPVDKNLREYNLSCPIFGGLKLSGDERGRLQLGGSALGGLISGRISQLDELRPQIHGDVCICDPPRSPSAPGDTIQ
jgi:hypothetical protein